jgi:kynurenine 3-monooxygenase
MRDFQDKPCVVVGSGLCGPLLAIMLARRGLKVHLYERRSDSRKGGAVDHRSINLALSARGLKALAAVGLAEEMKRLSIPMAGRLVHDTQGAVNFQAYGAQGQAILSIERRRLNERLMDVAEREPNVQIFFGRRCVDLDWRAVTATFQDEATGQETTVEAQAIFGADGAYSGVRQRLQRSDRFNFEQEFLSHGYKELTMPPLPDGTFAMAEGGLHIWPRQEFMLIALPNPDKTFTCTLFMAFEGERGFGQLQTREQAQAFMEREFPDVVPLIPDVGEQFMKNPTGSLVIIRCDPWHKGDRVCLLGDAAHAITPFYGQGMNASFEDCLALDGLLAQHGPDWAKVMPAYSALRKPHGDAICQLALDNFIEMRASVTSARFVWRKKFEKFLHKLMPETFIPLYTMVSFTTIPYADVVARARRQDRWLYGILWGLLAALAALAVAGAVWWRLSGCACEG